MAPAHEENTLDEAWLFAQKEQSVMIEMSRVNRQIWRLAYQLMR
jgi:hypothetical protein